jgi:predicted transport protein
VSFVFLNLKLKSYINIGINQINDPLKKAKDYAKFSGKIVEVSIKDKSDIPYALSLIKQAYERS